MNRPTDELETLLCMADEAIADGDFESAVGILREASSVAPLRRDVRNKLAVALERVPAGTRGSAGSGANVPSKPLAPIAFVDDDIEYERDESVPISTVPGTGGVDQISDVARKAFKAAAGTTARAGDATRHLTDLLQSGIKSWKSSLMEQVQSARTTEAVRQEQRSLAGALPGSTETELFTAAHELHSYLDQSPRSSSVSTFSPPQSEVEDEEEDLAAEAERITRPAAPVSRKSSKAGAGKKASSRPNDVEDVLAAGIGGLIEVIARTEKKKFVYAGIYMALGGLFAFACFDASRKFPGVQAVPAVRAVEGASLSVLDLSVSSENVIEDARQLVQLGKPAQAINLLENKLLAGASHSSTDKIRIELASQLNSLAEARLRNNQIAESADLYRKAVVVLPDDNALSLRLANALYYQGIMGSGSAEKRKAALDEGLEIVTELAAKGSENVQVYRVLALLHEAKGDSSQAKASWQKVQAMAPEKSNEQKEAASRLK